MPYYQYMTSIGSTAATTVIVPMANMTGTSCTSTVLSVTYVVPIYWSNAMTPVSETAQENEETTQTAVRRRTGHPPAAQTSVLSFDEVEAIKNRSKELLMSLLSDEQKLTLENVGRIYFRSQSGDEYMIQCNHYSQNVYRTRDGKRFCAHINSALPLYDHFIAQMFMLMYDEAEFLRIANVIR